MAKNLFRVSLGLSVFTMGVVGAILLSCSDDSSANRGYQGLGSKWTLDFTASTFQLSYDAAADDTFDTATDMVINGTYTELSNKFIKMTVTSAEGATAPAAGSEAVGLEIPGFAFFLKPLEENAQPIVMVSAGTCPTQDVNMNWVIAKFQDPSETPKADNDAYGTAAFDIANNLATIAPYEFLNGAAMTTSQITHQGCSTGTITFDDGGDGGTMYATSNGGMLVNPGTGVIFAAPQLSTDPTSSDWDGTYSGLLFSGNAVEVAKVVLDGTGGTGDVVTDLATDTTSGSAVVFSGLTATSGLKGIVRGQIGGRVLNCVFSSVSDDKLLACNGADGAADGDGVYPIFFFLGVMR